MLNRGKYRAGTAISLALAMLFSLVLPAFAGAEDTATLPVQLVDEQTIGEGVVLQTYNKKISGKNSRVLVTKVDLNNPYAQVKPLYGKNGTFSAKQSVENMAKEKGAIAAINADFFNMKDNTPFGITLDQGNIISSMGRMPYWHSLGILRDRTAIVDRFSYQGKVTAASGASFPIQGVNKQEYKSAGYQSHKDQINMYTPAFGAKSLGLLKGFEDYIEVVVQGDVVQEVRIKQPAAVIPANGYVLWGHGAGAKFLQEQMKVGEAVQIASTHLAVSGAQGLDTAMAGHVLLVDNGKPLDVSVNSINGKFSRSGVGVSQDGKTIYLVAVEGPPNGRGMELKEFSVVMKEIGSYRAFNLDGGGSTTMVARKLAESNISLLNTPAYGSQRAVPTAIGVFNTAPTGAFRDFRIEGPAQVLKGSEAAYSVKGWDEHYHPFAMNQQEVVWTGQDAFTGNKLLALTSGVQNITADYQGVQHTKQIEVIGAAHVEKLLVEPSVIAANQGQTVPFKVKVKTKAGQTLEVTPQGATASVSGEIGTVSGFSFTAGTAEGKGELVVNFDGLEVKVPVSVGAIPQPFESFDSLTGIYHTANPAEISSHGSFSLTQEKVYRTNKGAKLHYNFEAAPWDEIRVAYGMLGSKPINLPGTPIGIGLWVYGDNSKHWLRSELTDANGKVHYMTLAKEINFDGWSYVKGNIPPEAIYPVKMKSIYVVSMPEGADQRPNKGTIYFDEMTLYQPYDPAKVTKPATIQAGEAYRLSQEISIKLDTTAQVEPVSTIPLYMPGKKPVLNGVKISGEQNPKTITLTPNQWPDQQGVGLLYLDEQQKTFREVKGSRQANGDYVFPVQQGGTYVPYYTSQSSPFRDVKAGVWYEPAIVQLHSEGIINGMSKDRFAPDAVLTRAQFVTILGNWLGWKEDASMKLDFKDSIPSYAVPAVNVALSKGIVQGFPGQLFKPDASLTRAQMAVMLYNALRDQGEELTAESAKKFADQSSIPGWAAEAIQAMAGKGYIKGIGNSFKPDVKATRAQAAVLIYQIKK